MERCGDHSETDCLRKEDSPDPGTTADPVSTCGRTEAWIRSRRRSGNRQSGNLREAQTDGVESVWSRGCGCSARIWGIQV